MAMDMVESTANGNADDKDTLYMLGGVAMIVFGAGLILSNPVIRRYMSAARSGQSRPGCDAGRGALLQTARDVMAPAQCRGPLHGECKRSCGTHGRRQERQRARCLSSMQAQPVHCAGLCHGHFLRDGAQSNHWHPHFQRRGGLQCRSSQASRLAPAIQAVSLSCAGRHQRQRSPGN